MLKKTILASILAGVALLVSGCGDEAVQTPEVKVAAVAEANSSDMLGTAQDAANVRKEMASELAAGKPEVKDWCLYGDDVKVGLVAASYVDGVLHVMAWCEVPAYPDGTMFHYKVQPHGYAWIYSISQDGVQWSQPKLASGKDTLMNALWEHGMTFTGNIHQ